MPNADSAIHIPNSILVGLSDDSRRMLAEIVALNPGGRDPFDMAAWLLEYIIEDYWSATVGELLEAEKSA